MYKKLCISLILVAGSLHLQASVGLIAKSVPTPICYLGNEQVVKTAIDIYASDAKLVTGNNLQEVKGFYGQSIIVGTLGKNLEFDRLIEQARIDVHGIKGEWEAFCIQEISIDHVKHLLVIGSDARGTAYGVLELSRMIGVSPWVWWADATPDHKENVCFNEKYIKKKPSVQYRGVFINDEDWGLNPWSYKNFELSSKKGNIGPKTYEKVFELLLRLRANIIWPAMHECTIPFFFVEGNKEMANKYGIVLGTSHCEPMMRNSAGEWDRKKEYNYKTNKKGIQDYWAERLDKVKDSECIFTVGLRGVHDGKMVGVEGVDEETSVLGKVINDQRNMISRFFNCKTNEIPQIFVPYKEVLKAYNNGLKLPDDISLVWCDDNHGYITRLSNKEEQNRVGGAGVYYHTSYWGKPHDYLWLASTQPGLIYKEMKRAWDYNAKRLWILNVGDIKPGEYLTNFFLDMAWDINFVRSNNIYSHQQKWYSDIFGKTVGEQVDSIMREFYRLAAERKPEHMGWSFVESEQKNAVGGLTPVIDTEFNPFAANDEVIQRITEYNNLSEKVKNLEGLVDSKLKNAFFELVTYPINAATAMNEKLLYAQLSRTFADYNLPVANEYKKLSENAFNKITALTYTYNEEVVGGKWNHMMDLSPRDLPVFKKAQFKNVDIEFSNDLKIHVHGNPSLFNAKDELDVILYDDKNRISIFDNSNNRISWNTVQCPKGIVVTEQYNGLIHRLDLNIEMKDKEKFSNDLHNLVLSVNNQTLTFKLKYISSDSDMPYEKNGCISFKASDFYSNNNSETQFFEGLGHSGKSVLIKTANKINKKSPCLVYKFKTNSTGEASINVGTVPVHPANSGDVRIGIAVDNAKPVVISVRSDFLTEKWTANVLRNQTLSSIKHDFKMSGEHTIRLYALDNDICFDQLKIDFINNRKSYLLRN